MHGLVVRCLSSLLIGFVAAKTWLLASGMRIKPGGGTVIA
jgi:hypothetical protein